MMKFFHFFVRLCSYIAPHVFDIFQYTSHFSVYSTQKVIKYNTEEQLLWYFYGVLLSFLENNLCSLYRNYKDELKILNLRSNNLRSYCPSTILVFCIRNLTEYS